MLSSRKRAAAYFKYLRPSVAHTPILPRALDTVKFWSIISLYSVIIFVRFNRTPIDTQSLPDSYPTITAKEGQRWDERGGILSEQHLLQLRERIIDIFRKSGMVQEIVRTAGSQCVIEVLGHGIDKRRDGHLNVILLPVHSGIAIDTFLLMKEAIGSLDTFFGKHNIYKKDSPRPSL